MNVILFLFTLVAKLTKQIATIEIQKNESEHRLEEAIQQYSQVQEEQKLIISESTSKVAIKDHVHAITELKKFVIISFR